MSIVLQYRNLCKWFTVGGFPAIIVLIVLHFENKQELPDLFDYYDQTFPCHGGCSYVVKPCRIGWKLWFKYITFYIQIIYHSLSVILWNCSVPFHEGFGTFHMEFFQWSSIKYGTETTPIVISLYFRWPSWGHRSRGYGATKCTTSSMDLR